MPKAQYSITIHRPVSQVFAFMEDFQTDPLWRAHVLEMRITSAQRTGLGASHIEVREMFGKRLETPASIIGYERNQRLEVQRASGPIRPIASYLYEASADSTRLTLVLTVPFHGAALLLTPLIALLLGLIMRAVPADFAKLKALLEQSERPAQASNAEGPFVGHPSEQ